MEKSILLTPFFQSHGQMIVINSNRFLNVLGHGFRKRNAVWALHSFVFHKIYFGIFSAIIIYLTIPL